MEPDAVPDESRLRMSSRYCSFATTLLCKPIKHGLTIYCLVFCRTKFLYNWEWFTGKKELHGHGQPTDATPLDEDHGDEIGYILPLLNRLITPAFDGTGTCFYTDKAFTSIKLARSLAKRRLAIIGMLRTLGRPKHRPRGDENYWAFRGYTKAELDQYIKGYRLEAFTRLAEGDVAWLKAELWRDAKWVTALSTSFYSKADADATKATTVGCPSAATSERRCCPTHSILTRSLLWSGAALGQGCERAPACDIEHCNQEVQPDDGCCGRVQQDASC